MILIDLFNPNLWNLPRFDYPLAFIKTLFVCFHSISCCFCLLLLWFMFGWFFIYLVCFWFHLKSTTFHSFSWFTLIEVRQCFVINIPSWSFYFYGKIKFTYLQDLRFKCLLIIYYCPFWVSQFMQYGIIVLINFHFFFLSQYIFV